MKPPEPLYPNWQLVELAGQNKKFKHSDFPLDSGTVSLSVKLYFFKAGCHFGTWTLSGSLQWRKKHGVFTTKGGYLLLHWTLDAELESVVIIYMITSKEQRNFLNHATRSKKTRWNAKFLMICFVCDTDADIQIILQCSNVRATFTNEPTHIVWIQSKFTLHLNLAETTRSVFFFPPGTWQKGQRFRRWGGKVWIEIGWYMSKSLSKALWHRSPDVGWIIVTPMELSRSYKIYHIHILIYPNTPCMARTWSWRMFVLC